jgi:hypothetical protein
LSGYTFLGLDFLFYLFVFHPERLILFASVFNTETYSLVLRLPVLEATQQEESQHAQQQQWTYNSVLLYSAFNQSTVRAVSVLAAIDTVYAAALQLAKAHASLYSLCMPTVQTKQQFKKQFNNNSKNNSTTIQKTIQQQFNNNSTTIQQQFNKCQ